MSIKRQKTKILEVWPPAWHSWRHRMRAREWEAPVEAPFLILRPDPDRAIPLIVHVPHAGSTSPEVRAKIALSDEELAEELIAITDRYVHEMARSAVSLGATVVINMLSRLVVDPERFPDPEDEPMEQLGQGAVYVRTMDGRRLRTASFSSGDRESMMQGSFLPYAEMMENLVEESLERFDSCRIVDAHSFPTGKGFPSARTPFSAVPDICLGFTLFHMPYKWVQWWQHNGWASSGVVAGPMHIGLNEPYSGSYVPLIHFETDCRVKSLMIEVNRSHYMDEKSGERRYQPGGGHLLLKQFLEHAAADICAKLDRPEQTVGREKARDIAVDFVWESFGNPDMQVVAVTDRAEIRMSGTREPRLPVKGDCWIAYARYPDMVAAGRGVVVCIDKRTGKIVHFGPSTPMGDD